MAECTRFIMEQAAVRVEEVWRQGGTTSLDLQNWVGVAAITPLIRAVCLMDGIALEAARYAVGLAEETPGHLGEALDEITKAIENEMVPVLRKVIMDHIQENPGGRYTKALSTLGASPYWQDFLNNYDPVQLIWYYNDVLCQGGEEAAGLIRKAIKEL